jgi:hypothetical protein
MATSYRKILAAITCVLTAIGFTVMMLSIRAFNSTPRTREAAGPDSITTARLMDLAFVCKEYRRRHGAWPSSITALTNVISVGGPSNVLDGWGRAIRLIPQPGSKGRVIELISYGADGLPGGVGSNVDVICQLP